jgi:hypothetical protein
VSIAEGASGDTVVLLQVSLNAPAGPGGVTFTAATANGTALAGQDYTATTYAGLTMAAGDTTFNVAIPVTGDAVFEPNETFFVNITNVTGATVADGQGLVTIINDEAQGTVSVTASPGSLAAGNTATFTVTPSFAPPNGALTVQLTTGGVGGGALNVNTLTFTTATAQTFAFTAAAPAGSKTIQYSLSGADAGAFTAPATTNINVVTSSVTVSGAPANMTVGQVATMAIWS